MRAAERLVLAITLTRGARAGQDDFESFPFQQCPSALVERIAKWTAQHFRTRFARDSDGLSLPHHAPDLLQAACSSQTRRHCTAWPALCRRPGGGGLTMADNLSNRGPADRSRINLSEDWERRYWTEALGISEEQLRTAVKAVGSSADAVRAHLQQRKQ